METLPCTIPETPLGLLTQAGEIVADEDTLGVRLLVLMVAARQTKPH